MNKFGDTMGVLSRKTTVRLCLTEATKAQEVAAYCYVRAEELREDSSACIQLMNDAAYWSARARMFLFQTIGDGAFESECAVT